MIKSLHIVLIIACLGASCTSNVSIIKRQHNKGYYITFLNHDVSNQQNSGKILKTSSKSSNAAIEADCVAETTVISADSIVTEDRSSKRSIKGKSGKAINLQWLTAYEAPFKANCEKSSQLAQNASLDTAENLLKFVACFLILLFIISGSILLLLSIGTPMFWAFLFWVVLAWISFILLIF